MWAVLMVVVGGLLSLASCGVLIGGGLLAHRYSGAVHSAALIDPSARTTRGVALRPGRPVNILLIGIDRRPDESGTDPVRSDSIIIVHVAATHDRAYLVSVPRDLVVDIPGDVDRPESHEKINAAFAYGSMNGGGLPGGMRLLSATITRFAGIRFDAGAIINFGGFQAVVNALGGVDMCIDERVVSIHTRAVYLPGCRHLRPWEALDYVRQRENLPGGDYDRQRHQQQFLKAVLRQATGTGVVTNPARLDTVLRAAGDALVFDGGGASPVDWAYALRDIGPAAVLLLRTAGHAVYGVAGDPTGYAGEGLDPTGVDLFQRVERDDVDTWVVAHPDMVSNDK